jgi:hypothetical protein
MNSTRIKRKTRSICPGGGAQPKVTPFAAAFDWLSISLISYPAPIIPSAKDLNEADLR